MIRHIRFVGPPIISRHLTNYTLQKEKSDLDQKALKQLYIAKAVENLQLEVIYRKDALIEKR